MTGEEGRRDVLKRQKRGRVNNEGGGPNRQK